MEQGAYLLTLEIAAVVLGLIFIVLLIQENIWCWLFGILSSVLNSVLMYHLHLYSETFLYIFYIGIGFYGLFVWRKKDDKPLIVKRIPILYDVFLALLGVVLGFGIYNLIKHIFLDAERPLVDAFTSAFSFIASFMEAQKLLSSWVFWIFINAATFMLYLDRGLKYEAMLMVVYFLLSIFGLIQWYKKYKSYNQTEVA